MKGEKLLGIQVLRFFAAAAVALCHANAAWQIATAGRTNPADPMHVATAGVDVFFVISGFVIATVGPLATPRPTARRFFVARWRRVVPAFWTVSLVAAGVVLLWPPLESAPFQTGLTWPQIAATVTMWPVWSGRLAEPSIGLGWTLCLEMIFYSAVSLMLVGGRLRRNLVFLACAGVIGLYFRAATNDLALRVLLSPMLIEFGCGVALAMMRTRLAAIDAGVGLLLMAVALMLFVALGFLNLPETLFDGLWTLGGAILMRPFVFGPPAVLLVAGALIAEPVFRGRLARLLSRGGDASYSIYVAQAPVLNVVSLAVPLAGGVQIVFVSTAWAIMVAAGIGCYLGLERPLLSALRRRNLYHRLANGLDVATGELAAKEG